MDLTDMMTFKERCAIKQKRRDFLSKTIDGYSSLEDYARDKDEWFAVIGMNLQLNEKYISIENWLDGYEYEEYFIIPTADGRLTVKEKLNANTYTDYESD